MLHSPPPTSSHLGNLISLFPYNVICVMAVWGRIRLPRLVAGGGEGLHRLDVQGYCKGSHKVGHLALDPLSAEQVEESTATGLQGAQSTK